MTKAVDNQKGSAARKTKFTTCVVDPDPGLLGQVGSGSGIIVSYRMRIWPFRKEYLYKDPNPDKIATESTTLLTTECIHGRQLVIQPQAINIKVTTTLHDHMRNKNPW
jgi:hypothetical protein